MTRITDSPWGFNKSVSFDDYEFSVGYILEKNKTRFF